MIHSRTHDISPLGSRRNSAVCPLGVGRCLGVVTQEKERNIKHAVRRRKSDRIGNTFGNRLGLATENKRKWLGIAKRYPKMAPQEQERVQKRMHDWARLTPEQRRVARESYKNIAKAPPEKRVNLRQQWAEYQALPQAERQSLVPPAKPAPKKKKP